MTNANSIDKSNLRQTILDSPHQFEEGMRLAKDLDISGEFDSVTISGMGGSALPGDILRVYVNDICSKDISRKHIPIFQNRFYELPPEALKKSLNIISSYSGNTEESISSFEQAIDRKLPTVAIFSGGVIEKMASDNHIPSIKIPSGLEPRSATGYFFGAMSQLMINAGMIPDVSAEISGLGDSIKATIERLEIAGQALAKKIRNKIPVVYSSVKYAPVAMIWKIKLNENAKTPAFWNYFPELNHNEMNGFEYPQGNYHAIMLLDPEDHPQNRKRFSITQQIYAQQGIETDVIEMEGNTVFEKIFLSLNLGDWTSFYLALEYGLDPSPVGMVERFKKMLK